MRKSSVFSAKWHHIFFHSADELDMPALLLLKGMKGVAPKPSTTARFFFDRYRVALYVYPTRCGHADCVDASYQRAIFGFIDAMADLVAKDILKEQGRSYSSYIAREESKVDLAEMSERYLLPEYDLDIDVPSSQNARSKPQATYRLQGKIGRATRK